MKYRDLILVLVLVAVGVLWWSGPQSAASENPEGPARAVATEATPAARKTPAAEISPQPSPAIVIDKLPRRMDPTYLPRPVLTLTVKNEPEKLENLVISANLKTTEPAWVYVRSDSGNPEVMITASLGEQYWSFRSKADLRDDAPRKVEEDLSWDVKLSELVEPEKMDELRSAYQKSALNWVMTVAEAEEKTNPMTRRVAFPIMGVFTTGP